MPRYLVVYKNGRTARIRGRDRKDARFRALMLAGTRAERQDEPITGVKHIKQITVKGVG